MTGYAEHGLARSLGFLADSQAAISNNIANATTYSYKRKTPLAEMRTGEFHSMLERSLPTISYREATDFSAGSQRASDTMNVALGEDQFFRVQNSNGSFYTRRGEFVIDAAGDLVTSNGDKYMNAAGEPIRVGLAQELRIARDGTINALVNGQDTEIARLGVYKVLDQSKLTSIGGSLYLDKGNQELTPHLAPDVRQGYLEESNVDVLKELVQMITVQRSFGATTQAMSTIDRIQESFVQAMQR